MAGDDKSGAKSRRLPRVQTSKAPLINYGSSHKDRHVVVYVVVSVVVYVYIAKSNGLQKH